MKICSSCYLSLPLSEFNRRSSSKDGYGSKCRSCKSKHYFQNKTVYQARNKKWLETNKIKRQKYQSQHGAEYYRNVDKARRQTSEYKDKRRKQREVYASNPKFRLTNTIRHKIWRSLKSKKNKQHWESLVGYTLQNLMTHLESLFLPGMTWDNYGKWHVDHIKPVSKFDIISFDCVDFKKCWALENLQPLWKEQNLSKGSNYSEE